MSDIAVNIENVYKQYRLGLIGGGTLQSDFQSWWARIRKKEDQNTKIGIDQAHYGKKTFMALNDVSLSIKKGEALGIIGHNGAGKSTLLKLLSKVTAPTAGAIYINGRISSMLEVGTGFHGELTGRENIYLNGAILGMTKAEIDSKLDAIIEFSECSQFIETPVKRYSSGMYVKLAFAVAANLDSEILIMDEVLAVGDMNFQQKCLDKMSDVARKEGRTVLYVSHNMNTIQKLCNRCIVMDHGKIIFDGDVDRAISIYSNLYRHMETHRDYSDFVRKYKAYASHAKITSAAFLGKESYVFFRNEKMKLSIRWENLEEVNNLCLRYEIRTSGGVPLGTFILMNIYSGEIGKQCEIQMECDISNLVPGKYWGTYTLFYKNDIGDSGNVDCVPGLGFEIITGNESSNLKWDTKNWGYVDMKPVPVFTIKENEKRVNAVE